MFMSWMKLFDNFGVKSVTKTDKAKAAYVLSKEQLLAITSAGIKPETILEVPVIGDTPLSVTASFYNSIRDGVRPPEARLGRETISEWLEVGDQFLVANIGTQLYFAKVTGEESAEAIAVQVTNGATGHTRAALILRANEEKGPPKTFKVLRKEFARSPLVIAGTLARADGKCEMPDCASEPFNRHGGGVYLEVHHVIPLAEGGEDSLLNACALCPRCHRRLHFGDDRIPLRRALTAHLARN